jgi:dTDP-4-dehydrorhamnose 3,5-epimerase
MTVHKLPLSGAYLIEPAVYGDARGFFMELWNHERYATHGMNATFVQDNISRSARGVLRGLHFQNPHPQGKLVSVLEGEVYDVIVDIRAGSETFGAWHGAFLSAQNKKQVYVPEGFAHGFLVTSESALFHYKCTDVYAPEAEASIRWDDPALAVDWPTEAPTLSEKDRNAPRLSELPERKLHFADASSVS